MYVSDWNTQAKVFNEFSIQSYAWKFIEQPALDNVMAPLLPAGTKVLDVGCGAGRISSWLTKRGVPPECITGLDISPPMLQIARTKHPSPILLLSDITKPLPTTGHDLAVAVHVFQHLDPTELGQALTNIWQALIPGGSMIYIVGHPQRDLLSASVYKQPAAWRLRVTPWGTWVHQFYRSSIDEFLQPTTAAGFILQSIQILNPINEGQANAQLFKDHTVLPSRLLVHAIKPSPIKSKILA